VIKGPTDGILGSTLGDLFCVLAFQQPAGCRSTTALAHAVSLGQARSLGRPSRTLSLQPWWRRGHRRNPAIHPGLAKGEVGSGRQPSCNGPAALACTNWKKPWTFNPTCCRCPKHQAPRCQCSSMPAAPGPACASPEERASWPQGIPLGRRFPFQLQAEQGALFVSASTRALWPAAAHRQWRGAREIAVAEASAQGGARTRIPPNHCRMSRRWVPTGPPARRHLRCAVWNTSSRVWRHRRGCPSASPMVTSQGSPMAPGSSRLSSCMGAVRPDHSEVDRHAQSGA